MKKILLIVNILFVGLVLMGAVGIYVSRLGATLKFAEFDRAGCINRVEMESYSKGRFINGDRQGTVLWLASPIYHTALANLGLAMIMAVTNLVLITCVLLKEGKSTKSVHSR
jgi:hypothetical protein